MMAWDLETYVFNLINADRAALGLPPYTWDDAVAEVAHAHSVVMAESVCPQHQCPGEPGFADTRLSHAGISYTYWGENIGYWYGPPTYEEDLQNIHQFFISEGLGGGHYDNLMSPTFQVVGIGVIVDASGIVWVTEDFLQP
jgi:uncharacterized protein YkwD